MGCTRGTITRCRSAGASTTCWRAGTSIPIGIAVTGSNFAGYYAARAGSFEDRLAAVVSHGAIWSIEALWGGSDDSHGLAGHIRWVFGAGSMAEALEKARPFTLEGIPGGYGVHG